MILCVDPGAKKAGAALFESSGALVAAWLAEGKDWRETADDVRLGMPVNSIRVLEVVIEHMQIYQDTPTAQANACILLSLMAGRVTGLFAHSVPSHGNHAYLPKTWKGQTPKKIHIERIKEKLTKDEHKRVVLPKVQRGRNDVWDAVGIGLYHLRKQRR